MNQTERYRLEALMELAQCYPNGRATARIAARREIPPAYLARLFAELARAGFVRSRRGPGGGVSLARSPEEISVAAVMTGRNTTETLPPALARLAGVIDRALESSLATISVADLARWEKLETATLDYSI